jgi:hypothetical protein
MNNFDHEALMRFKAATVEDRNRLAKLYRGIRKDKGAARAREVWQEEFRMAQFIAACIERSIYTGRLQ